MTTTTILPTLSHTFKKTEKLSVIKNFFTWADGQQSKRIFWQGISLTALGCIFTPLAMIAALLAGVYAALYIPVIGAIVISFICNLAALPTKITIPVFFLSILIDLAVMLAATIMGLDFTRLF